MRGPDSWAGRPRGVGAFPVSKLSKELRALFKKRRGKKRWTTEDEVRNILALERFTYQKEDSDDDPALPPDRP